MKGLIAMYKRFFSRHRSIIIYFPLSSFLLTFIKEKPGLSFD